MLLQALLLSLVGQVALASTCTAYPKGYYSPSAGRINGVPATTAAYSYSLRPDFLSCAQVQDLNQYCVNALNKYRLGQVAGQQPTGHTPLVEVIANRQCVAEVTMGDFALMGSGQCGAGAHKNAYGCSALQGAQAQNSCCPRFVGNTFGEVTQALDECLAQMYFNSQNGGNPSHLQAIQNPSYKLVSCGFAFGKSTADGGNLALMNQNFATEQASGPTRSPTMKDPLTGGGILLTPAPMVFPTGRPTKTPTKRPTKAPTTKKPTKVPTAKPSKRPTFKVTKKPTKSPTKKPTKRPTLKPTKKPTKPKLTG
ncbi:hypothetical protein BASA81_011306 [Batrachochytrium salamandrivorans]|nr:hypothetical protein BASA81_011306 [Batrachochytrium salamandrivorans]